MLVLIGPAMWSAPVNGQPSKKAETMVAAALDDVLIEGNLQKAIDKLRDVVARFEQQDRQHAAQALFLLAELHRLKDAAEAHRLYERLVREFADQKELVAMAKYRLNGQQLSITWP